MIALCALCGPHIKGVGFWRLGSRKTYLQRKNCSLIFQLFRGGDHKEHVEGNQVSNWGQLR